MKLITNIILWVVAAVGALGVAGCSKEVSQLEQIGSKSEVAFRVVLPQDGGTRAISDGSGATALKYSVHDEDGTLIPGLSGTATLEGGTASINVSLVKNMTYKFIFWAQNPSCSAYNTADLTRIVVSYEGNANDEARDAFYAVKEIFVEGSFSTEVVLRRPFAQINFGSADIEGFEDYGALLKSTIEVDGLPQVFYPLENGLPQLFPPTGSIISGSIPSSFTDAVFPGAPAYIFVDGAKYRHISMNYVLAPKGKDMLNKLVAKFTLKSGKQVTIPVSNVPVQANYRTNIVGNLFTDVVNIKVVVDADFLNPDNIEPFPQKKN